MSHQAYTLLGLTAIVGGLVGLLVFAFLRFSAAARDAKGRMRESSTETALLSAALEEAIGRLKAQERAMTARAEASERLSGQIVASLTAGLVVTDLGGRVQILNPSSRRLLGLSDDASPGLVREVLGSQSALADAIEECLREGQPIVRRSIALNDPHTEVTHLGVTVSPLVDEGGAPAGVICLFTDLTKVMDLEEQLRLKDMLARLGELTAGLAHEFRNGLATIHGYARLMDPEQLPSNQRTYLEGVRAETDSLGAIVTNFLNFARPTQLAVTPVDVRDVIGRVADDVRADATALGGRVAVEGRWGIVSGDEVLLRQAFSNLARNAVEACAPANIALDLCFLGEVDAASQTLRVSVTDNGPGIEAASRERVFRPFFTTKPKGTGLGLALVQKIVVTHNGRVLALDGPGGQGATMLVTLPLIG
jgi:signal transduction histidine kinase